MRFIHTADWHIGMGASHVPTVAESIRAARLETAKKIIGLAQDRQCDFIIIAGDLFDSNVVSNELVHQVLHILEQANPVQVYILPGNHDLLLPGSVYQRPAFRELPPNVHVLGDGAPVYLQDGSVALLPAPVTQKRSEMDPTLDFPQTPEATHRIGVAHGSLCIEGKYQRDDHPIALDAATRGDLDYLALGHWHSYVQIGDVTIMPGTPEPMAFGEESGHVVLVDMGGSQTLVEKVPVNTLTWLDEQLELEPKRDMLSIIRGWETQLTDQTLLRLKIAGYGTGEMEADLEELADWLNARLLYLSLDTSQLRAEGIRTSASELIAAHPFLAGVLTDLSQLLVMADPDVGQIEVAATDNSPSSNLEREVLRELLHEADHDPAIVQNAIRQLVRLVQGVSR